MQSLSLLDDLVFDEDNPNAQPLLVDSDSRILRFALKPGQKIEEHTAPSSPLYMVVLKGTGLFSGGDGKKKEFGPNSLLVFEQAEPHSIEALQEDLIFLAFLKPISDEIPPKNAGGLLGRAGGDVAG
jgi:quercetin dioxygenase-like cupin family protein